MVNRSYSNLSRKECLVEYQKIADNSEGTLKSATILAAHGQFANATSLLIISNEELIKSFILFLDTIGFDFRRVQNMKGMFQNHKLRYLFSMLLLLISLIGEDLGKKLIEVRNSPSILFRYMVNRSATFESLRIYILENLPRFRAEITFFSRMDKARQTGFYSELDHAITEEDYHVFYSKIIKLRETVSFLKEALTDSSSKELIQSQIKTFVGGNYAKLDSMLYNVSGPKIDSYEDLLGIIDKMEVSLKQPIA